MTKAELLRLKLQEEAEKKTRSPVTTTGDNASYPFWNMADGSIATVRFLPDADPDNAFFWVTREVIKLPFEGQVGGDYPTDKPVVVTVPCMDMFGETCPIIAETRPWWKQGDEKEKLARLYYKKKSHIFQGFVVSSPFEEQTVPENPIRRLVINSSIFEIIKQSLMSPEMEDLPTDYVGGRDFKISKTKKGDYANYGTSIWSFRTRPLNDIELAAIEQYGLFNLADFRGPRPDADGVRMIKAMFHDSLAGKPFDFDAYGKTYRAYSNDKNFGDPDATYTRSVSQPVRVASEAEEETVAADTVTKSTGNKVQAAEILDRIRKRTINAA